MQKLMMMTLALVIVTGCTTVGTNTAPASKDAVSAKEDGQNLREVRQHALLEALGGEQAK